MPSTIFLKIGATVYHHKDKGKGKGKVLRFVQHFTKQRKEYWLVEVEWENGERGELPKAHCRAFPDRKSRRDATFATNGRIHAALKRIE